MRCQASNKDGVDEALTVQNTLMPPSKNISVCGVQLCGYYRAASECGGDWWNFYQLDESKILVFVGDVTGHGTASAMLSAVVRGFCDSISLKMDGDLSSLCQELNSVVYNISNKSDRLMTLFVALIDLKNNQFTYCSAGHNPALYINKGKEVVSFLECGGSPLGLRDKAQFKCHSHSFNIGDMLFIYTDGLTECKNSEELMFGEGRLVRSFKKLEDIRKASDVVRFMKSEMDLFCKGKKPDDDVMMVSILHHMLPTKEKVQQVPQRNII